MVVILKEALGRRRHILFEEDQDIITRMRMEFPLLVSYHLTTRQCMLLMALIVPELAVPEGRYVIIEVVETQCIGGRHHTWPEPEEEIPLCHLYTIALQPIL